jgi:hypothetical protein
VSLSEDVDRIAAAAAAFAAPGERVVGVLATEPPLAGRVYLCVYESGSGRAWLALDDDARPLRARAIVRAAASLSALCEIAEETAGGGDLSELRARLAELRRTEAPEGIEQAEEAAAALERTIQPPPRVASSDYLDALGAAARRLEQALGDDAGSPFAVALQQAVPAVEELTADVEQTYKGPLA